MQTEQSSSEQHTSPVHAFALFPIFSGLTGGGAASEWKLPEISLAIPGNYTGSILLGVVGILGIVVLIATLRPWRSWAIILLAYLADMLLTFLFIWPIRGSAVSDPLSLWPYVLTTLATFCAGIVAGFAGHRAPLRHACGLVSIDFVLSGILCTMVSPQAATWKLISRVVAAYGAAMVGSTIGQYSWAVLQRDKFSVGRLLSSIVMTVVTAILGGIVTNYLWELPALSSVLQPK